MNPLDPETGNRKSSLMPRPDKPFKTSKPYKHYGSTLRDMDTSEALRAIHDNALMWGSGILLENMENHMEKNMKAGMETGSFRNIGVLLAGSLT